MRVCSWLNIFLVCAVLCQIHGCHGRNSYFFGRSVGGGEQRLWGRGIYDNRPSCCCRERDLYTAEIHTCCGIGCRCIEPCPPRTCCEVEHYTGNIFTCCKPGCRCINGPPIGAPPPPPPPPPPRPPPPPPPPRPPPRLPPPPPPPPSYNRPSCCCRERDLYTGEIHTCCGIGCRCIEPCPPRTCCEVEHYTGNIFTCCKPGCKCINGPPIGAPSGRQFDDGYAYEQVDDQYTRRRGYVFG